MKQMLTGQYEWRRLYLAALFERDHKQLQERIAEARSAIVLRGRELLLGSRRFFVKRIALLLVGAVTIAEVVALTSSASGYADKEAVPIYGIGAQSLFVAGAWQVDNRLSDAQLTTDATTDYGKRKIDLTVGFARINGEVKIDDERLKNSRIDLTMYPASSIFPSIDENGIFLSDWIESRYPHHTLVCFHSKRITRTPDGRLQADGELALTSVDRNVDTSREGLSEVQADPSAVVHRISHEVTFFFDLPVADESDPKSDNIRASGSTTVSREYFPQIVRTVISTYWPPLIQEENCAVPVASEVYGNSRCTGTFLEPHGFPQAPQAANGKDSHGPQNFNTIVGEDLTILVHMHLVPKASENRP